MSVPTSAPLARGAFTHRCRSVVDAVRCAIEVQNAMVGRNAGLPPERRIEFRVGIHIGDVVEESDGDLMGDGVNIAARLEGVAKPGGICLSEDAYRQVQGKVEVNFAHAGEQRLKNISRSMRAYYLASKSATTAEPARSPFMRRLAAALGAGRTRRDSTGESAPENPCTIFCAACAKPSTSPTMLPFAFNVCVRKTGSTG